MIWFGKFLADESGATAIEYGLIAAGISVAIIATVAGLGSKLNTTRPRGRRSRMSCIACANCSSG